MPPRAKVVVTDYVEPDLEWESRELARRGVELAAYQLKGRPEAEVAQKTADADIVVVNMVKVTPSLVGTWRKTRVVIRHGAGYDNVDVPALTEAGILAEYVPDYCQHEVAEHAVALIYACARKVLWSQKVMDDSIARGEWDFRPVIPMYRMEGRTVGIVGCGRIGALVYRKLQGAGVKFLICDPFLSAQRQAELGLRTVDLEALCRGSDFVTLHTPLNDQTRKLINAEALSWMKPTAYLINTSRGGMVDHEALAEALKRRQIAGAAIDVFEKEPPPPDFPLIGLDNVLLTPHLSWYSEDAGQTIREKIVQSIEMYLEGKGPRCPLNAEELRAKGVLR